MIPVRSIQSRLALSTPAGDPISGVTGVILAAGLGQRMGHLTFKLPKPMLPVLNCPLVWWNMTELRRHGVRNVAINTYYLPDTFSGLADEAALVGIHARLVSEAKLTGPFGGVIACSAVSKSEDDLLVLAGDGIYDLDVRQMVSMHRRCEAVLTVGVAAVQEGNRYGVLSVDNNGDVRGMVEKPAGIGSVETASCGVYVVSSRLLELVRPVGPLIDWIDVVTQLLESGHRVIAVNVGAWTDVGTPAALLEINQRLLIPEMLHKVADRLDADDTALATVWTQGLLQCTPTTRFEGAVLIGESVRIGAGVRLENTVVGPRATIGDGAVLCDTLVMPDATVAEGMTLTGQVVS